MAVIDQDWKSDPMHLAPQMGRRLAAVSVLESERLFDRTGALAATLPYGMSEAELKLHPGESQRIRNESAG